jgi:hypothetical protein
MNCSKTTHSHHSAPSPSSYEILGWNNNCSDVAHNRRIPTYDSSSMCRTIQRTIFFLFYIHQEGLVCLHLRNVIIFVCIQVP